MTDTYRLRATIVFVTIAVIFIFLIYRFYSIQVLHHSEYVVVQQSQIYYKEDVPPKAGMILDRNGKIIAISKAVDSVAAIPNVFMQNPANFGIVSQILKMPVKEIRDKIEKAEDNHKSFIWLKRRISPEESIALHARKIKGIEFRQEYKRFYPNGTLACHILGFRGLDEKALGGIELAYNKYLMGEVGYRLIPRDAHKQKITSLQLIEKPPVPGNDIYLTIDSVIQFIVEKELADACKKWRPISAEAIVLKPSTGEILALANRPVFDPNQGNEAKPDMQKNRVISDPYEPGSAFKPFIASMLLLSKMAQPGETIFCENGTFKIGKRIIHDHERHGKLTFADVVAKSSNIGMAKLGMRFGKENIYNSLVCFDFGKPTGLGLSGESTGIITPPSKWNDYTVVSVPMGHEVAVTSLQLAKAFNVFANNGTLVKPYLIQKISDASGKPIAESKPTVIRQILDNPTYDNMRRILRAVVESGTATLANIKDYAIAGKTGTAQKINPDGTYSHNKFKSVFIGFAPVEDPQILVLVVLDEPKGNYFGGVVSAPVVSNIIQKTLKYLGVSPRATMVGATND